MRRLLAAVVVVLGLAAGAHAVHAKPPHTHEILYNRPSGFWTSNRPAVGGAYRYRLMGIGLVIAGLTAWWLVRLIRRANADRLRRFGRGWPGPGLGRPFEPRPPKQAPPKDPEAAAKAPDRAKAPERAPPKAPEQAPSTDPEVAAKAPEPRNDSAAPRSPDRDS